MKPSKFLFSFFLLFLFACSEQHQAIKAERKMWGYRRWKSEFKSRAFCLCLLEGYDNKEVKQFILQSDVSYRNPIAIAVFDTALKPVIREEVLKMKRDSAASINKMAEPLAGKNVFDHCLNFYKSKRLNSVANKEKQKWKNIKDILGEVQKYIPSW